MRVLHVVHQYAPSTGGAEKYVTDLSEALVQRGHDVDVFTSRSLDYQTWENALPQQKIVNGVHVHRFDALRRGQLAWKILRFGYQRYQRNRTPLFESLIRFGNGPVMPGMYSSLARKVREYDVVHIVNLHYAHALPAYRIARRKGTPVVLSPLVHIEQPLTYDAGYMLMMLEQADGVIALTKAERDFIVSLFPNQRVTIGGGGLDLSQFPAMAKRQARENFQIPENAFVVLFLGRKTDYKRLDLVYAAFKKLVAENHNVWLLAVGPETEWSQRLAERYTHLPNVVHRGRVDDATRLAALASADVLAMPSEGESFGIVYLEAWAYKIPVIGARLAAVSSLIDDNVNGMLTEVGSGQAVFDALQWMCQHREAARAMGAAGYRKLYSRYQVSRIAENVEGVYIRAIRHHNSKYNSGME